jgi:hydroxymethylglutaryl-CoA synthase
MTGDGSDARIAGVGAYAPRLRIAAEEFEDAWGRFRASGIEQKAVPETDEDALTMAVEAARRGLAAAGADGGDVTSLVLATTTPPMAEEDLTARLGNALGVPRDATTRTETGSTRAGAQALDAVLDRVPEGVGVVVASDCPQGAPDSGIEHAAGAGAAAVVVDDEGPGVVLDRGSYFEPYPGTRVRGGGEGETEALGITQYDREAFRTALGGAVDELSADVDVDAAAVQSPDGKLPYRAADALGVAAETIAAGTTVHDLGDTGAASTLLGLAEALGDDAERVLVAAYGSGAGANALLVDAADVPVAAAVEGRTDLSYPAYLRRRGEVTGGEPEGGGAYVSVPTWQRTHPQRHRLVAGGCPSCGALNFPPTGACRSCSERPEYESLTLPGTGTVELATTIAQGGAPPEFVEQQARSGPYVSAVVAFDGPDGERTVSAPTQIVGAGADDVGRGTSVVATIRRIYEQEGVIRYGFKVQLESERRG